MSNADSQDLVSSKKGVAKINSGLSEKMGLELSQRVAGIGMDGEEREDIQGVRQARRWDGPRHVGREWWFSGHS